MKNALMKPLRRWGRKMLNSTPMKRTVRSRSVDVKQKHTSGKSISCINISFDDLKLNVLFFVFLLVLILY